MNRHIAMADRQARTVRRDLRLRSGDGVTARS
jgi:hypothetical protein